MGSPVLTHDCKILLMIIYVLVMYDCVSPHTVMVMQCILAFCFIVILLSLIAFLFDLSAPSNPLLKSLRRNAVFNVLAGWLLFFILKSRKGSNFRNRYAHTCILTSTTDKCSDCRLVSRPPGSS